MPIQQTIPFEEGTFFITLCVTNGWMSQSGGKR